MSRTPGLALAALAALAACTDAPAPLAPSGGPATARAGASTAGAYIIRTRADALPDEFAEQVQAAGGTVTRAFPELGLAVATSTSADFAARASRLAAVASVIPDLPIQSPDTEAAGDEIEEFGHTGPVNPHNDPLAALQWSLDAIDAPEAWALGATGAGVRVAVIDGGFDLTHPDLNDNIDLSAARSFVPGIPLTTDPGFSHGTHVSGIIAAEDNNIGVIGIAPRATLIPLKALHLGRGEFSWIIEAIHYAATPSAEGGAGADVINLSLGALLTPAQAKLLRHELDKALDRVTRYAWQQGVTVVAAAGNSRLNLDAEGKHFLSLPADNQHVIAVSATAPVGWGFGNTDFARPTSYTNTGKSLIDLAAPGGGFGLLPSLAPCTVAGITRPCFVFDGVLSTLRGGYGWVNGTSMASPAVAGVAALVIGQSGGEMHPAQVAAALRQGALDLGKPGRDEVYGHGFLNAHQAVLRAR